MALFEVEHLKKYFPTSRGMVHAVDDVSFSIEEGMTMGLVGESGCGKSTLGRTMIHLLDSTEGTIRFRGEDVTHPDKRKLRKLREDMQIIFQDPYSSLNPRMTIQDTIMEPLKLSGRFAKDKLEEECVRLMDLAGIEKRFRDSYPHELDGGRRQRIGIARALSVSPAFIVCDEPVSALDVSIQAQILNLLKELQKELGLTLLFVGHGLGAVNYVSDQIAVMYLGKIVEYGDAKEIFHHPVHPYTQALLEAVPIPDPTEKGRERSLLQGEIGSSTCPPEGCRFHPRCPYATEQCRQEIPEMQEVNGTVGKALEADAESRRAQGRNAGSVKAWEADTESVKPWEADTESMKTREADTGSGKAWEADTGSGRMQAAEIGDRMAGDREQAENPGVHMAACPVVLNG